MDEYPSPLQSVRFCGKIEKASSLVVSKKICEKYIWTCANSLRRLLSLLDFVFASPLKFLQTTTVHHESQILSLQMCITTNNIQRTLRHVRKYVELSALVRLDGLFKFNRTRDTFLVEHVHKTVEYLKMEGWSQKTTSTFPSSPCHESVLKS